MSDKYKIAYFGGDPLGAPTLKQLAESEFKPSLVVCNPDRKSGRGRALTPPATKTVAEKYAIEVTQPEELNENLFAGEWDLFVVVAYNKILPQWLIDLPKHKTINLHPSLLPKYRGPNPIRESILNNDQEVGVSVMLLDDKMDHGPLLSQKKVELETWPIKGKELDEILIKAGGNLLLETIPRWLTEKIKPIEQNHDVATYTHKVTKQNGELVLDPLNMPEGNEAKQIYLKILAYDGWPGTFFFYKGKRYKVIDAHLDETGKLHIDSLIPEGKPKTSFLNHFG